MKTEATNMKKNDIELYLEHIEDICGGEGTFTQITEANELLPITVISYQGIPDSDCVTAFSFGLSSAPHKEWIASCPELVISVNSLDVSWSLAMGELIRNGRDKYLFEYGNILNFGQKISDESDMTCFLIFACTVLDEDDLLVELNHKSIHISQIYPIYESEIALIKKAGAEHFVFNMDIDLYDVKRQPIQ